MELKVLKSTCSYKHYEVQNAKVEGTDPEFGSDWSFSFSYGNGSAAVYAWVVLEGVEDEVELVLDERSGLTDTVDNVYTELSKNVLKQAAHVRGQLPDAIASWRANNPSLEDRLSLDNVKVKAEDGDSVAVVADLLVDGEKVYDVLEWLDDDCDLVRDDRHLDVNPYHIDAVEQALWGVKYTDFRSRVSVRVNELLEAALAQLATPPERPQDGEEVTDESVQYDFGRLTAVQESATQLEAAVTAVEAWNGKSVDDLVALLGRVKWLEEQSGKHFSSTRDDLVAGIRTRLSANVQRVQKSIDALDPYTYHVHAVDVNGDAMVSSADRSFLGVKIIRATVAKPSKYPIVEISVDELPRELADEVVDYMHEAFKVAEFESPILGRDEPETCTAYILLVQSTSRAGVVVGNGSASWYDTDNPDAALDAYLAECAAVAAEFADREAA